MRFKSVALFGVLFLAGQVYAEGDTVLKDQKDRVSYSLGVDAGYSLKNLPVGIDLDLFLKGIKDVISETKPLMSEQEMRETLAGLQKELKAKYEDRMRVLGEKNKKEGESFLAENKNRDGVITLPSGLEYKVLKAGTGRRPTDNDTVTVQYRGTLIDGTEFDSSYRRGEPLTLPVNGVIPGWTEALKLMQEGSKWQLVIPPNLAYGDRGAAGQIGPNATLIFEVDLLAVK